MPEGCVLFVLVLNRIMLSVVMQNYVMLSVIMLSVVVPLLFEDKTFSAVISSNLMCLSMSVISTLV
jgi:hypothetical protein